jgi:acyl-CoA synthetase (NDP forming)
VTAALSTPDVKLDGFIRPTSLRLVGRMDNSSRPLGKMANYLRRHGFTGTIQVADDRVNQELLGRLQVQPVQIDDETPADVAVVAVRAPLVPDIIRRLGRAGHSRAIVLSSGFSEIGSSALERELVDAARSAGIRVLGPNCQGIWNRNAGFAATFSEYLELAEPAISGRVAVVSQSGAVGYCIAGLLDRSGTPAAVVATTGNEADVEWSDMAKLVANEPGVDTVLAYLEQVDSADQLASANEVLRARGVRLAILKGGRTRQGNQAAASHTAAVASDRVQLEHLCYDLGIAFAHDLPDLVASAMATSYAGTTRRVAVISTSGGAGVIAADLFAENGTHLPELGPATRDRLAELLGPYAATRNPVDVTAASAENPSLIPGAWAAIMESGQIDNVVIIVTMVTGARLLATVQLLINEISRRPNAALPVVVLLAPPEVLGEATARLHAAGIPTLQSLTPIVKALAAYRPGDPAVPSSTSSSPPGAVQVSAPPIVDRTVSDMEILSELADRGLPVVARGEFDLDDLEPTMLIAAVPPPYVVKLITADVHKAAAGNVDVGPYSADDVAAAARDLIGSRFAEAVPRVQVQHYTYPALEVFLGVQQDAVFGQTLTLGIGGRLAEPLAAMRHFRLPADMEYLSARLRDSLLGDLLASIQADAPDRVALLALEVAEYFTSRGDLAELDVNPIVVTTKGDLVLIDGAGVRAADHAMIVPRQEG